MERQDAKGGACQCRFARVGCVRSGPSAPRCRPASPTVAQPQPSLPCEISGIQSRRRDTGNGGSDGAGERHKEDEDSEVPALHHARVSGHPPYFPPTLRLANTRGAQPKSSCARRGLECSAHDASSTRHGIYPPTGCQLGHADTHESAYTCACASESREAAVNRMGGCRPRLPVAPKTRGHLCLSRGGSATRYTCQSPPRSDPTIHVQNSSQIR